MVLSFGNFLKKEREKKMWTQTELGAKIGLNSCAISRIENGNKAFSICKLDLLSEILQIDSQELRNLFFADKFAREAYKHNCSADVFNIAPQITSYLTNTK